MEAKGGSGGSSPEPSGGNVFANDGSFLELFKRKMEEEERRKKQQEREGRGDASCPQGVSSTAQKPPCNVTSFVGRRRGGAKLALKTGMVAKKQKLEDEVDSSKGDAWTKYMAEVMKYKAHQCGDDDKTRPLVK
ncbi:hypothetical protein GN956_G8898 [Arapaima gigas]